MRGAHWRTGTGAWLMYTNGAERPASFLAGSLRGEQACGRFGGAVVQRERKHPGRKRRGAPCSPTDADAGTTLSQWQIDADPSGKFAIDAATGTVSLATGASLDFEVTTSYQISVSVWDGYNRSVPAP
jgi:hypothetical protein